MVEGTVRLEAAGEVRDASADEVIVVPTGVPHKFRNAGTGRVRMVNIHGAARVVTDSDVPGAVPGKPS